MKVKQIDKKNQQDVEVFLSLLKDYLNEIDSNVTDDFITKFGMSIINKQGDYDRHLELCYMEDTLVGFLYVKVDHEGHLGFIKPSLGYIMEFYVIPQHRTKGYGRVMFNHIENLFKQHKVKRMYLTTNTETGEAFWHAMGFKHFGETSPDNQMKVYEKDIQ